MNTTEMAAILEAHGKWLRSEEGGQRADLSGADLSGANLGGAYLSGADLSGAYLSGADLSWVDLSGADLSGAYLRRANLRRADLGGADLSGAYLSGADLGGVDLSGVYLRRADLSGVDLSGVYLSGADLSGAYLSGADLGTWFVRQIGPVGSRGDTLVLLARPASDGVEAREEVRTGCFGSDRARTLAEFERANDARQDGKREAQEQYRRVIAWLRAEMAAAGLPEMAAPEELEVQS